MFFYLISVSSSVLPSCSAAGVNLWGKLAGFPGCEKIKQAHLSKTGRSEVWAFYSIERLMYASYMNRCAVQSVSVTFLSVLWLAHLHIEKLRMWPITHLSLRVSHCRSWGGKRQDLLGTWAVSPRLTPALITIHEWEKARSQACRFTRPALRRLVKWLIRPTHISVLIINMHHADWKNHTHLAVWISKMVATHCAPLNKQS